MSETARASWRRTSPSGARKQRGDDLVSPHTSAASRASLSPKGRPLDTPVLR